jgi:acetyltransferase-like isoleucine patch superfamily enzyme
MTFQKASPDYRNARYLPWLWPIRLMNKFRKDNISTGLLLMNFIFQKFFDINNSIPWSVHYSSTVQGKIKIGKNVWRSFASSSGCYIQGANGIEIGDDTIFAPGVKIISSNHNPSNLDEFVKTDPIRIGRNSWIGANAVILPGIQLGDHVIVGAGAIVTHSFPSYSVIAGNPARLLRTENKNLESDNNIK